MNTRAIALAASSFLLLGSANATTQTATYSSENVIALTELDWEKSELLFIPRFNLPGTLTEVKLELFGSLAGDLAIESRDAQPAQVSGTLSAELTLTRPDSSLLVVAVPAFTLTLAAAAFDGVANGTGTSGISGAVTPAPRIHSESGSFSSSSDLALFTGADSIGLPVMAVANTITSGTGNIWQSYYAEAGAWARVTYTYAAAPVPEPETWALMLGGLLMTGFIARRRTR